MPKYLPVPDFYKYSTGREAELLGTAAAGTNSCRCSELLDRTGCDCWNTVVQKVGWPADTGTMHAAGAIQISLGAPSLPDRL